LAGGEAALGQVRDRARLDAVRTAASGFVGDIGIARRPDWTSRAVRSRGDRSVAGASSPFAFICSLPFRVAVLWPPPTASPDDG
jgi:hypothetical protein